MNFARLFVFFITLTASTAFAQDQDRDCSVRDGAELRSARTLLNQKSAILAGAEIARIDVHSEYSAFNLAALKLRTLARFGRCNLHLTEVDENFVVRSDNGTLDQFEVSGPQREVISWKHSSGSDSPHVVHFSLRGEVDFKE